MPGQRPSVGLLNLRSKIKKINDSIDPLDDSPSADAKRKVIKQLDNITAGAGHFGDLRSSIMHFYEVFSEKDSYVDLLGCLRAVLISTITSADVDRILLELFENLCRSGKPIFGFVHVEKKAIESIVEAKNVVRTDFPHYYEGGAVKIELMEMPDESDSLEQEEDEIEKGHGACAAATPYLPPGACAAATPYLPPLPEPEETPASFHMQRDVEFFDAGFFSQNQQETFDLKILCPRGRILLDEDEKSLPLLKWSRLTDTRLAEVHMLANERMTMTLTGPDTDTVRAALKKFHLLSFNQDPPLRPNGYEVRFGCYDSNVESGLPKLPSPLPVSSSPRAGNLAPLSRAWSLPPSQESPLKQPSPVGTVEQEDQRKLSPWGAADRRKSAGDSSFVFRKELIAKPRFVYGGAGDAGGTGGSPGLLHGGDKSPLTAGRSPCWDSPFKSLSPVKSTHPHPTVSTPLKKSSPGELCGIPAMTATGAVLGSASSPLKPTSPTSKAAATEEAEMETVIRFGDTTLVLKCVDRFILQEAAGVLRDHFENKSKDKRPTRRVSEPGGGGDKASRPWVVQQLSFSGNPTSQSFVEGKEVGVAAVQQEAPNMNLQKVRGIGRGRARGRPQNNPVSPGIVRFQSIPEMCTSKQEDKQASSSSSEYLDDAFDDQLDDAIRRSTVLSGEMDWHKDRPFSMRRIFILKCAASKYCLKRPNFKDDEMPCILETPNKAFEARSFDVMVDGEVKDIRDYPSYMPGFYLVR